MSEQLIPAIIQDANTQQVLMLAYMNQEAYEQTIKTKKVTFYSRKRQKLWVKGETSGNYLQLVEIVKDCDEDTYLIKAIPAGPTCHKGTTSCFAEDKPSNIFLQQLEQLIKQRDEQRPENSYTTELLTSGLNRIAQKVGEEATEVVIAALAEDKTKLVSEISDLLYHLLVLMRSKQITLNELSDELATR